MTANIKAIALIAHGPGYTSDLVGGFQHCGSDAALTQLVGCRQTGRACPNDDSGLPTHLSGSDPADEDSCGATNAGGCVEHLAIHRHTLPSAPPMPLQ